MKELIRLALKTNTDLSILVRGYLKSRPKDKETGIYNGI